MMRGRDRQSGQAMVEFAITAFPFFVTIYSVFAIWLHAIEMDSAIAAASRGARVAVTSQDSDLQSASLGPAEDITATTIGNAVFSGHIHKQSTGAACPSMSAIAAGDLWVCATIDGNDVVTTEVKGKPVSLFPPGFDSYWTVDEAIAGKLVRFRR